MIGPGGLLLVVPPPISCLRFSFMGGVAKEQITKLGREKYFSQSHTLSTPGDAITEVNP